MRPLFPPMPPMTPSANYYLLSFAVAFGVWVLTIPLGIHFLLDDVFAPTPFGVTKLLKLFARELLALLAGLVVVVIVFVKRRRFRRALAAAQHGHRR